MSSIFVNADCSKKAHIEYNKSKDVTNDPNQACLADSQNRQMAAKMTEAGVIIG